METRNVADKARIIVAKDMTDANVVLLLSALYRKNRLTYTHSINVGYLTAQICIKNKFEKRIAEQIVTGALLHDVGKLFTPNSILTKKGSLTEDEYGIVKLHTSQGAMLLENLVPQIATDIVLDIVENHHEKPDGSGYHKKTDVSLEAQLIHAVDVYDALTSDRTYRQGCPAAYSIETLFKEGIDEVIIKAIAGCCVK